MKINFRIISGIHWYSGNLNKGSQAFVLCLGWIRQDQTTGVQPPLAGPENFFADFFLDTMPKRMRLVLEIIVWGKYEYWHSKKCYKTQ